MKMRVQLVIEDASGARTSADIAAIERRPDDLIGLSLEEAKAMTGALQRKMVEAQAREVVVQNSTCAQCQSRLRRNGTHRIYYRTPFGRLDLDSPRFYRCRCQTPSRTSISPLALWLGMHTSPELEVSRSSICRSLTVWGIRAYVGYRTAAGARHEYDKLEAARRDHRCPLGSRSS